MNEIEDRSLDKALIDLLQNIITINKRLSILEDWKKACEAEDQDLDQDLAETLLEQRKQAFPDEVKE